MGVAPARSSTALMCVDCRVSKSATSRTTLSSSRSSLSAIGVKVEELRHENECARLRLLQRNERAGWS